MSLTHSLSFFLPLFFSLLKCSCPFLFDIHIHVLRNLILGSEHSLVLPLGCEGTIVVRYYCFGWNIWGEHIFIELKRTGYGATLTFRIIYW